MANLSDTINLRDVDIGTYIGFSNSTVKDLIDFLNQFPDNLEFNELSLNRVTDIEYDKDIEHITCSFEIQKIIMRDKRWLRWY